jgi:hypothetical protein
MFCSQVDADIAQLESTRLCSFDANELKLSSSMSTIGGKLASLQRPAILSSLLSADVTDKTNKTVDTSGIIWFLTRTSARCFDATQIQNTSLSLIISTRFESMLQFCLHNSQVAFLRSGPIIQPPNGEQKLVDDCVGVLIPSGIDKNPGSGILATWSGTDSKYL